MAITSEERQELIQDVINEIATQSTSIDELDVVDSVNLVDSLPAYRRDTSTLVKVPIPLISKPATDAAVTANAAAQMATQAAQSADAAKEAAEQATADTLKSATAATEAADEAREVASGLSSAVREIRILAANADILSRELKEQLGEYTIVVITEEEYEALPEKEDKTIYFCTESEETT